MATTTKAELGALASRFIDIDSLPWVDTAPGNEMKVLMHDAETGMLTLITRLQPGACVPYIKDLGDTANSVDSGLQFDVSGKNISIVLGNGTDISIRTSNDAGVSFPHSHWHHIYSQCARSSPLDGHEYLIHSER